MLKSLDVKVGQNIVFEGKSMKVTKVTVDNKMANVWLVLDGVLILSLGFNEYVTLV